MSEPARPARSDRQAEEDDNLVLLPLPAGGEEPNMLTASEVGELFGYQAARLPPVPPVTAPEPPAAERAPAREEPMAPRPVHVRPARRPAGAPARRSRHAPRRHGVPVRTASPVPAPLPASRPSPSARVAVAARRGGRVQGLLARFTTVLLVLSLMLGWAVLALTIAQHVWGYNSYVVLSGSMRPTIPVGTLVLDQPVPASEVVIGDILSFHPAASPSTTITHRVVAIEQDPPGTRPGLYAKTKGDANPTEDPGWLPLAGSVNRVAVWVPGAGYAVTALERPGARVLLVLLPLGLMATLALSAVWRRPR